MATVLDLLALLIKQQGDNYKFGHEVDLDEEDPDTFDCSELVQWACHKAGVKPEIPDRSWIQWQHCKKHGTLIPVESAKLTPGALLFRFRSSPETEERPWGAHVAVSLGSGLTFEASREIPGVGIFTTENRLWTDAALVPGVDYSRSRPPQLSGSRRNTLFHRMADRRLALQASELEVQRYVAGVQEAYIALSRETESATKGETSRTTTSQTTAARSAPAPVEAGPGSKKSR